MSLANASFRAVGVVSLFCDVFLTSVDLSGAMDQGKERIRLLDGIRRIGYRMAPRDITYTLVVSVADDVPETHRKPNDIDIRVFTIIRKGKRGRLRKRFHFGERTVKVRYVVSSL
jgi:hypothetical protein